DRAAAEQEGAVHPRGDDERRVHRRLVPDRDAGQDDGRRPGQRGLADVLYRTPPRFGEVPGQRLDDGGQHDADDDRDDRDPPAVARLVGQRRRVELAERGGQVGEGGDRDEYRRDRGGDVERAVDRGQAGAVGPAPPGAGT